MRKYENLRWESVAIEAEVTNPQLCTKINLVQRTFFDLFMLFSSPGT